MNEKLQEILRRQQESEYLKEQNITSRHQLQKLRSRENTSVKRWI